MNKKGKKTSKIALAALIAGGVLSNSPINVNAAVNHQYDLVELSKDLISNGGLENNGKGWKVTGDGKFVTDGTPSEGKYCGLLPSYSGNASVYQPVSLKKNTDYVLKAKVQLAKEGQTAFVNVKKSDLSGWPIGIQPEITVTCTKEQEWQYQDVELKFNSGENTSVSIAAMKWVDPKDRNESNPTYTGQAYIDEVSLTEANAESSNYDIVWADDFNENKLDTSKWGYELGCIRGVEQQHYTKESDNVFVKDGQLNLQITDRNKEDQYKNPRGNRQVIYDSGSIRTHGKQEFLYGRIEIKAKLPKGKGVFPAFWTLGSDFTLDGAINGKQGAPWPVCGEIDIMELTGKANDSAWGGNQTVWQTLHYGNGGDKDNGKYAGGGTPYALPSGIFNDDYHIFGLNWSKGKMEWYVDNKIVRTVDYSDDPLALLTLDRPQYVQLNLAAGGNWPGDAGLDLAGQKFEVDYIYYGQNEQQKADAKEYYDNAAKINGVKNVEMYEGEILDLLNGITSTKDTTVDFSVENEHMFTNVGGQTKVELVCRGKDDVSKLATLPVGQYNIHYTAIPNKESDKNKPYTRQSATLTVKERTLEEDLENNGIELVGYMNDTLSTIALPEGWSWVNPDEIIRAAVNSYKARFSLNGFTKEQDIIIQQLDSYTKEDLNEKIVFADKLLSETDKYTEDSLKQLREIVNYAKDILLKNPTYKEITEVYSRLDEAIKALKEVEKNEIPWTDLTPSTPIETPNEDNNHQEDSNEDKEVQTGDPASIMTLGGLALLSATGIIVTKRRKDEE